MTVDYQLTDSVFIEFLHLVQLYSHDNCYVWLEIFYVFIGVKVLEPGNIAFMAVTDVDGGTICCLLKSPLFSHHRYALQAFIELDFQLFIRT